MDQQEFDRHFEYLDECVVGGLEFLARELEAGKFPELELGNFKRPLVVGSGNALATGRILYQDYDAVFADESTYEDKISKIKTIDGIAIVSATGGKDAVKIA
ncbi:MAG: hypothetical protein Q8N99_01115 [Nanoarchaeota archaeon]|nr:hypothetical protein [Nanoarchaeota archaeon]